MLEILLPPTENYLFRQETEKTPYDLTEKVCDGGNTCTSLFLQRYRQTGHDELDGLLVVFAMF